MMGDQEDMEDEVDYLYEDIFLPVFSEAQTNDNEGTESPATVSSAEFQEFKELTSQLTAQNTALKKNISCLYKTAQQELQRKESLIERLMKRVKWLERDLRIAQELTNENTTSDSSSLEIATSQQTTEHSITSKDESPPNKILNTRQKMRDHCDTDTLRSSSTRRQTHQTSESNSRDQLCQNKSQNSTEHHISNTFSNPNNSRPTESPALKRKHSRETRYLREERQRHERKEHLLKRHKENHHHLRRSERKRKHSISPSRPDEEDLRETLKRVKQKRSKQEPSSSKTKSTDNCNAPELELNHSSYKELIEENLLELEYDEPFTNSANPPPLSSSNSTTSDDIKDTTSERTVDKDSDIVEQSTPSPSEIKDKPPPSLIQATSTELRNPNTPQNTETELEDGEIEDGEIEDSEIEDINLTSESISRDQLCQNKSQNSTEHHISNTFSNPKNSRPTESPAHKRKHSRETRYLREEHQRHEKKEHLLKRDKESHHHLRRSERKRKHSISSSWPDKEDLRERLKQKRSKQEPSSSKTKSTDNCNAPELELNPSSYKELIEENLLELEYDEPFTNSANPPPLSSSNSTTRDDMKDTTSERTVDKDSDIVEQSTPSPSEIKDKPPPSLTQATSTEMESPNTPQNTETELEDGEIEDGEIEDGEIEDGEITKELDEASQDRPKDKLTCHSKEHKSKQQPTRRSSSVRTHKQDYHSRERRKVADRRDHDDRRRSSRSTDLYSRRDNRRH